MKITEVAQKMAYFFKRYLSSQKMDWATVWATFSQTHLVTLPPNNKKEVLFAVSELLKTVS
jgi:hypothetical protein